ncbi:MAG: hypothetical protein WDO14_17945 [Bacteroidota bacterium]
MPDSKLVAVMRRDEEKAADFRPTSQCSKVLFRRLTKLISDRK